jgi:hypothetical protein
MLQGSVRAHSVIFTYFNSVSAMFAAGAVAVCFSGHAARRFCDRLAACCACGKLQVVRAAALQAN